MDNEFSYEIKFVYDKSIIKFKITNWCFVTQSDGEMKKLYHEIRPEGARTYVD